MAILLDNDYIKIINYIFFQKKEVLKKLVYHSYRKSIAETLYKIINYDVKLTDYNLEEEEYDKEIDLKKLFFSHFYSVPQQLYMHSSRFRR